MTTTSDTRLPPGPRAPAFLQTLSLVRDPIGFLEACRARFGDAFTLRISGYGPLVHLSDPEDLRTMFNQAPDDAHAGESNFRLFGAITGRNTSLTLDGAAHLRRRRAVTPAYHGDRMAGYVSLIESVALAAVRTWPRGRPFALHEQVQAIALEVILRAVFGLDDEGDAQMARLRTLLVRAANEAAGSPLLLLSPLQIDLGRWSPWGKIVHLLDETRAALSAEITRRRAQPSGGGRDILSMLLAATGDDGEALPDDDLRDELIVQLLAGHETTASALAWAFACLLDAPEALERVRAELVVVAGQGALDPARLPELRYLDAVVRESMRLRPIMPTAGARELRAPLRLARFTLPAGVFVANSEVLLHRRPDLYPDPLAFKPERFLDGKPAPYTWTPFGGGGRRCLGMAFALTEMKVVLATVLSRLDLRLAKTPVRTGRRGFFIAPDGGPKVIATERVPVEAERAPGAHVSA